MPVVQVNGIDLYYKEAGNKAHPPLLLLHGLTSHHHRFIREIEVFKKDFYVIAVDARGHGKSNRPECRPAAPMRWRRSSSLQTAGPEKSA